MRVVAYAVVALALGAMTPIPAAAQCYGPECESPRSGPSRYYTERPPEDGPRQRVDRPPERGNPDDRGQRPGEITDARPQPWPPSSGPRDRRPDSSYRRVREPPPASNNYQRFWDDRDDRRGRTTARPAAAPRDDAPPQRVTRGRSGPPVARTTAGPGEMVISVAEYRALRDQVRELHRLLGDRGDVRDDRRRDFQDDRRRDFRDDRPSRDVGPRDIYR